MPAFQIGLDEFDKLHTAMVNYGGDAEDAINSVLHGSIGDEIQAEIKRLMPVSGKTWRGKKGGAKGSNSLRNVFGNLSVTVTTQKAYQYLYFPDDGSSTRKHAGNQQFFLRGGEAMRDEIVDRCIAKLVQN